MFRRYGTFGSLDFLLYSFQLFVQSDMRIPCRHFGLYEVSRCCHGVTIRAVLRNKIDCSRRACFGNDVFEVAAAYLVDPEELLVAYIEVWGVFVRP